MGKGIRVSVADLVKFVHGLQELFLNSPKSAYMLGQLANHNIRDVLEIARSMVNSPYVGLDEMFKVYVVNNAIHVPDYKIRKALIRGRYDMFLAGSSKYVHNIFDLNSEMESTPLLGLRMLQFLKDGVIRSGDTQSRYTGKGELIGYFTAMGIERRAISLWLDALLKKALVLNYDPTCTSEASATQLELSPAGEQHLFWGQGNFDYLEAMAEVTPIRDEGIFRSIEEASRGTGRDRAMALIGAFAQYLRGEDRLFCQVPHHESYSGQRELIIRHIGK